MKSRLLGAPRSTKRVATFVLSLAFLLGGTAQAALIDFSSSSGVLSNGVGYSLAGSYSANGSTAVALNNQTVTITFDQAVTSHLLPSDPSSGTGIHNDDNGERINASVVGGTWSLLSNPNGEVKNITGLTTRRPPHIRPSRKNS